jgi:glycine dehydrogenase
MTEAIDLSTANEFIPRHIGPRDADTASMLEQLGYDSLDALIASVIPESIKGSSVLELSAGLSEADALAKIKAIAVKNQLFSPHIGQGYYGTHTPSPILRNLAVGDQTQRVVEPQRRAVRSESHRLLE